EQGAAGGPAACLSLRGALPISRTPSVVKQRRPAACSEASASCVVDPFRNDQSAPTLRSRHRASHALRTRLRTTPLARATHLYGRDRKSTRLNSSHVKISYAVFS